MSKYILILIGFLALSLGGNKLFSQSDDIWDKIENIKLDKMTEKLSLDETSKTLFIEKYKIFSKEQRDLNKKRARTYKLITENVESGNGLDSLLDLLIEYESEINKKRIEFIKDLETILTSQQIAKMIIFERKFNNEIKKILKQYQKENKKDFKE